LLDVHFYFANTDISYDNHTHTHTDTVYRRLSD